ncbi:hypothetical protein BCV69DRAFT_276232 [Microstroma glucosiphilum]|uniref:Uncharacterized protein n=1 Tax=Pseudomicrostroma glucosiphilum TaxID=1684307 RepID=A0A316UAK2_9BASI|nr:hypothetical protein BCV69DRAFT_276232 [Pseudomicrostroma glucosiphilum]PWN22236.1 hypothetical protein BCV69DRAFT_276232 [Pseudomicrostroma glucosiphilum]
MADRGQSLAAGRARIAAKSAHEFASGGIYVITIDFGNGTHGVYVGKSDKDIRHPMSGHDSAARAEESDRPSVQGRSRGAPGAINAAGEARARWRWKEKLQQLSEYTDFDLRNTLCSLLEAACVAVMCTFRQDLYMQQWSKVFGPPPAVSVGLNQDPATGGNYHEQLRVQKERGSEDFKPVVECPERSSLMQKLERGSVAKEKLQQLLVYTDFELRTTLCSLMEATCVAAMCAFRHDLYMDQWTKVFGRPPADARGLNQDTATGGNYHEQLRVQKARGSEVSKLGDDGKLQITRQSDGKLVVAYNKVSYIKKKGELVAELPVGDSADRFAEEYVGSDTLTKIVWQAQMDSQVAGREGSRTCRERLPSVLVYKSAATGPSRCASSKEADCYAFPRYHGKEAEELRGIGIELQAFQVDVDGTKKRQPSQWVEYRNSSPVANKEWIEIHLMVARSFGKVQTSSASSSVSATTATVAPFSAGEASPSAAAATASASSSSGCMPSGCFASPFAGSYLAFLPGIEKGDFVSSVKTSGKAPCLNCIIPPRRLQGEPVPQRWNSICIPSTYIPADVVANHTEAKKYSFWLHVDPSCANVLTYTMTVGPREPVPNPATFEPVELRAHEVRQKLAEPKDKEHKIKVKPKLKPKPKSAQQETESAIPERLRKLLEGTLQTPNVTLGAKKKKSIAAECPAKSPPRGPWLWYLNREASQVRCKLAADKG